MTNTNYIMRLLLAGILVFLNASAVAAAIEGAVLDVAGEPVVDALLTINGRSVATDKSGHFRAEVGSNSKVYQIRVAAPGHYEFIQTYSRADSSDDLAENEGTITVHPFILVPKKDGRRLMVFAGDTMMGRRFLEPRANEEVLVRASNAEQDMRLILQHVKPYLELADFASVNLETQLAADTPSASLPKSVTFFTHPDITSALRWSGVDYVALGNNHTFDYLDEGLEGTLLALRETELGFSGAGSDAVAARQPYSINLQGQRLNMLSYVGWPGNFEPNQVAGDDKGGAALGTAQAIAEDLSELSPESLTVLQLHSGLEYVSTPPLFEETQLKQAVDHGADLSIGHHSHVLQGFEVYRDKLIAYSLGNFIFDQYIPETQSAMLLYVWYDNDRFFRAEVVPLHIDGYVPAPATGSFRYDILQRLARLSVGANTCTSRSGGHLVVEPCGQAELSDTTQVLRDLRTKESNSVLHVKTLGADPLLAIERVDTGGPYRLGLDLLRRGDFETIDLLGRQDRSWVEHSNVSFVRSDSMKMRVRLRADEAVSTGMKVFTRVFSRSSPATVAGQIASDGCANLKLSLQRRPDGEGFGDSLINGPVTVLGEAKVTAGVSNFAVDFQLPRRATRSIRLLMDFEACGPTEEQVVVEMDNLSMVEWQTPWLIPGVSLESAATTQATHIQFQPLH